MTEQPVTIPLDAGITIEADLTIPDDAFAVVVFAHGSGSSRHSPRNRHVAALLQLRGLATVLADLLTLEEEHAERYTRHLRFDIGLLAERLVGVMQWLGRQPGTGALPIGYFGASTGAAAALVAAALEPDRVGAVVSRGGRPDLASRSLDSVLAPTLLIVGGFDPEVLALNRTALTRLRVEAALEVIPGAGHLFEEPGALDLVAQLASHWFARHLGRTLQPTAIA